MTIHTDPARTTAIIAFRTLREQYVELLKLRIAVADAELRLMTAGNVLSKTRLDETKLNLASG